MTGLTTLPAYTNESLAAMTTQELLDLLGRDEDRVPRNVIDECSRRGDEFVAHLDPLLQAHAWQDDTPNNVWWRLLHAANILGAIPTEAAGRLLAGHMRAMAIHDDLNLQDWLSDEWPTLFCNKPPGVLAAVRGVIEDRALNCYIRGDAIDALLAMTQQHAAAGLEETLDSLASAAQDESDDYEFRLFTACALLDYRRPRHRALLDTLAAEQDDVRFGATFRSDDVTRAYAATQEQPRSHLQRTDPWQFYDPQAIADRQVSWAEDNRNALEREARAFSQSDDNFGDVETYVRGSPKIGRNDPCPCGSGKKYKKCCLPRGQAA